MLSNRIILTVNDKLYLKNPEDTDLGKKIVRNGIVLIDEMGFEKFNFRKLAIAVNCTEASIYRYFENKNMLLLYLLSMYWVWQIYLIEAGLTQFKEVKKQIYFIIESLVMKKCPIKDDSINGDALYRIVIVESAKSWLLKEVDTINKEGVYKDYKSLNKIISTKVLELNKSYKYANSLASMVLEAAHQQKYFGEHLPALSDFNQQNEKELVEFLYQLLIATITKK